MRDMLVQLSGSVEGWAEVLFFAPVAAAVVVDRLARTRAGEARLRAWGPRELGRVWLGGIAGGTLPAVAALAAVQSTWHVWTAAFFTGLAIVGAVTARWLERHPKRPDPEGTDPEASA